MDYVYPIYTFSNSNIRVDKKLIMGKAIGNYVGLIWIYFNLIFKRGLVGIISLLLANVLFLFILDESIIKIIKGYCFISILMIYFIDFKNERFLFKIFNISGFSQKIIKVGIITIIGLIQLFIFLIIENDKIS
jgi:hypothetical protein